MTENLNINLIDSTLEQQADNKNIDVSSFYKDNLTSLFNGIGLEESMPFISLLMIKGLMLEQQRVSNATNTDEEERRKENNIWSIMYCDINGFSGYNNLHGHKAGDKVISELGQIIAKSIEDIEDILEGSIRLKSQDIIFHNFNLSKAIAIRKHGDEFIILLPNCIKQSAETIVREKINKALKENADKIDGLSLAMGIVDTTEIDIPESILKGEITIDSLNDFFNSLLILADTRMGIDKVMNMDEEAKDASILSMLIRAAKMKKKDLNTAEGRNELLEEVERILNKNYVIDEDPKQKELSN
jgi:GGDEF domain-containing protein